MMHSNFHPAAGRGEANSRGGLLREFVRIIACSGAGGRGGSQMVRTVRGSHLPGVRGAANLLK